MSHRWSRLLLLVLGLGCTSPRSAPEPKSGRALEQALPGLLEAARIPGLSIAVVRKGEPVWTGAYGVRNVETGAPVRGDTLFEAASLSKPVFAYSVLRLVERGELDLDQPLADILPYDRLEHDPRYKKITARLVLSHNSGLPNWGGTPLEMAFAPGERFGYSGEGYVYLQKTASALTGLSLNELARREVFEPLGMTHSSYLWSTDDADRMADGHDILGEVRLKVRKEGYGDNAAWSLLTTAGDYAKFLQAILDRRGLEASTWAQMLEPRVQVVTFDSKEPVDHVFWGLGLGIQKGEAGTAWFHWGDNGGYKAYAIAYPDRGAALVYFTNSDGGLAIAREIVASLVEDSDDALRWLDYDDYDSSRYRARLSIGRAFVEDGPEAGVARYQETASRHPDLAPELDDLLNDVGSALLREEDLAGALSAFELNAREHPDSSSAHEGLAEAYMTAGRYDAAIESFERAGDLDPENAADESSLVWLREGLEARAHPVSISGGERARLVGTYGPCSIAVVDGELVASIEGLKKDYPLGAFAKDTFVLDGKATYRLRFVLDAEGAVTKLVASGPGGERFEASRSK